MIILLFLNPTLDFFKIHIEISKLEIVLLVLWAEEPNFEVAWPLVSFASDPHGLSEARRLSHLSLLFEDSLLIFPHDWPLRLMIALRHVQGRSLLGFFPLLEPDQGSLPLYESALEEQVLCHGFLGLLGLHHLQLSVHFLPYVA